MSVERVKTEYTIIRSGRRSLGLNLDPKGRIVVRAPYLCPRSVIDRFVAEHSGWIEKQRARLFSQAASSERAGMLSKEDTARLSKLMKHSLPEKLAKYSKLLGVSYNRVSVRCQRSKWGSCSAKGNLNFNCLLMLAPEEVLDYVIVHELCHRRHMDHSKEFWAEVESVCPEYKAYRKWLRENGGALMMRVERGENDA